MATRTEQSTIRSFTKPDEVRPFDRGRFEVIRVGDATVGHGHYEPGWRWSETIAKVMGTPTCHASHLAYLVSGRLHVRMDDGTELEAGPGDVLDIKPGHDAWVVGDAPVEYLEFRAAETFATRGQARPAAITLMPAEAGPGGASAAPAGAADAGRRFGEARNAHRPADLDARMAKDVVDHDPFPGQEAGIEGFRASMRGMLAAFPDLRAELEEVVEAGDRAFYTIVCTGTHSAELFGVPATGNPVRVKNLGSIRVADGRIVESWGTVDGLGLLAQLGAAPWQAPRRSLQGGDYDIL